MTPDAANRADATRRAAKCASAAECEGFIAHAQEQLRRQDSDRGYWEAIRLAGLERLKELRGRK